jgi:hypothetical protein
MRAHLRWSTAKETMATGQPVCQHQYVAGFDAESYLREADPSSGALVGHCHDRNRSFDLSPSLAALVRT